MALLIGLTGTAGAGKDTVASRLFAHHDFVITSFAEPLRYAAMEMFGLDYDHFVDRDLKDTVIPYWDLTPRQMLQQLGTEAVQGTFGKDFWIKRWKMVYEQMQDENVVVTDVRFPLEAQMIKELGGVLIYIHRPGVAPTDTHSSAIPLPTESIDMNIVNDGDLKGLYQKVDVLMMKLVK